MGPIIYHNNIFTISELEKAIKQKDITFNESIKTSIIMLGTNDLRLGGDGFKKAMELVNVARNIDDKHGCKTVLCQIPPAAERLKWSKEVEAFNYTLEINYDNVVTTDEYRET